MIGTAIAALALAGGLAAAAEPGRTRLIHGFETDAEIKALDAETARVSRTTQAERVTQGKSALAITFPKAGPGASQWPGLQINERKRLAGWEGFDLLALDAWNLTDRSFALCFRFDDARTTSYETRAHAQKLLRPGRNGVAVPLKALVRENGSKFDVSSLRRVCIFVPAGRQDLHLVIDNLRLATEKVVKIDVPGARLFDFSAEGGMTFPGFVKVVPATPYSEKRAHGFLDTSGLRGSPGGRPDDLVSDAVFDRSLDYPQRPFTFRVDVRPGRHRVRYVITNPQIRTDSGVTIAGAEHKVVWTAEKAFSEEGIYFGLHDDYHPGQDVWKRYVDTAWPWRSAEVEVTGGHLDVTVTKAALAALIVYPAEQAERMAPVLADIERRRREQFAADHFVLKPRSPAAPAPRPTPEQARAGFIVFHPRVMDAVHPATVPTGETAGTALKLSAAAGQREPTTLAVYPLRDLPKLTASAGALTGPGGAAIPAERVDVRLVRYFLRPAGEGLWQPVPMQLVRPQTPLYKHFTRQFWITVDVPRGAAAGAYRGELTLSAGGASRRVPIELTVYPFELPDSSRASFGLYYRGPMQDRCIRLFGQAAPVTYAEALDRQLADMRRHGMTGVQLPMPTVGRLDGKARRFRLGFGQLETYVAAIKRHGYRADYASQMNTLNLAERLLRLKHKEFSPEFNAVIRNSAAEIDRWFKDRGLSILFWVVDEPREQALNPWNRNFRDTVRYLELYAEVPGVRTTVTPMGDENFGVDYTPMVGKMDVVQTHPWPGSRKTMQIARRPGRPELWLYNAGIDRLSYGFYVWKARATGRWQWHYQWSDTGYNPFVGSHWAVAYPSPDGPVPTLGYEHIAMGIVDYKHVELLEGLIARAAKAGADAAPAERLLKRIEAELPEWPVKGLGDGTDVGAAYAGGVNRKLDAWRAEIAREIIRLRAAVK